MVTQDNLRSLPFPVLGFVAVSGTGKTTLLRKLIPQLKGQGLRLGLIKHTHHNIVFDHCPKRQTLFASGVNLIAHSPDLSVAEWHHHAFSKDIEPLWSGINAYRSFPLDLLLIEGFKHAAIPKIELYRQAVGAPLLANNDTNIIAVASDEPELPMPKHVQRLRLSDSAAITKWICSYISGVKIT